MSVSRVNWILRLLSISTSLLYIDIRQWEIEWLDNEIQKDSINKILYGRRYFVVSWVREAYIELADRFQETVLLEWEANLLCINAYSRLTQISQRKISVQARVQTQKENVFWREYTSVDDDVDHAFANEFAALESVFIELKPVDVRVVRLPSKQNPEEEDLELQYSDAVDAWGSH